MPTLSGILETTRASIPALQKRKTEIEAKARDAPDPPIFLGGRDPSRLALIAEVKRRSPSAGDIAPSLDPVSHAEAYARAGAIAISVLTDGPYFGGSLDDLRAVARRVRVPVLRKDFIVDELQIAEARGAGASAILLIVRALSPARLAELIAAARHWGLEALVEVHDGAELDAGLASGARVIGVNSRNLDTFAVDTPAAWTLFRRIPKDIVAVAESGMASADDVRAAAEAGADAVLIGTALSAAPDPAALAAQFTSVPRRGR
ncbi:MAG TPA: indole-3-glycerol phosphate synthase TrpC [Gemmatimonadales bacterium]|nr:indole-3-glycerol phosphate synthase TrpC [Gemmatimonadales bacterium]